MIVSRIALFFLGLSLAVSPALAKHAPLPVATPSLPTVVNPDPAVAPENVVYLDLSNGGRVTLRLAARARRSCPLSTIFYFATKHFSVLH